MSKNDSLKEPAQMSHLFMNLFALCFCFKASEGTTQFILDCKLELPKHLFICSYAVALDVITVIETIQKICTRL